MSQASRNSFIRSTASPCGVCQNVANWPASASSSITELSAGIWKTPPPHSVRSSSMNVL